MLPKYCHNNQSPSINFNDDSHLLTNNYIITKQNCISLSNQSQSLLVSSLRASISHPNQSNIKRQKRLNSQLILNQRNKTYDNIQKLNNQIKYSKPKINNQCLANQTFAALSIPKPTTQQCSICLKQVPQIKQKLQKTTHRLQQLQALIKICFSKNLSIQNLIGQKNTQIMKIKTKLDDTQRIVKKNQQVLVKQTVNKGFQNDQIKSTLNKLGQRINQKNKQLNQIIQLEKGILQQKISKISIFYQEKFDSLISMVQQLAKTQQKINNSQRQTNSTLSTTDYQNIQQVSSINKKYMIPNQTKSRQPSSDKTRNQSKSKISYYLSKSNFNDTSTLGDTTINQLSVINGM